MPDQRKKLLLFSRAAWFPERFGAFRTLVERYGLEAHAIGAKRTQTTPVHNVGGYLEANIEEDGQAIQTHVFDEEAEARLGQWRTVRRLVNRISPDYVWVNEEPDGFWAGRFIRWAWTHPRVPILSTGAETIYPMRSRKAKLRAFLRRHFLWQRWTAVLACSDITADAMRRIGVPDRLAVITAYLPHPEPRGEAEQLHSSFCNETDESFVVGFAGRFCREKGWRTLLAAVATLPRNVKCLIAGRGPELDDLLLALELPGLKERCKYVGVVPRQDMPRFYNSLDCFVLPSLTDSRWEEQFGMVLAEAMSHRIPVVGSSSGAIPGSIGEAGLVFEEANADDLASKIKQLRVSKSLRERLADAGEKRFHDHFSMTAYAETVASALGVDAE